MLPSEGSEAVTNALEWLVKELGVEIRQGESSTFIPADLIVVNANLPFATETLLRDTNLERYN